MANSDKNIRITANRDTTALPKIIFTGQSNNPIALNVLDDNTISFEGSAGQLFSINNNLSSGYIFSINDISGIPSFRVNADGTVGIAEFLGNVGIGLTNPAYKLQISGSAGISGTANISGVLTLSSTTGSGSTTTGALVVSGGVGIGGSIFSSSAYASSLSGVVFNNGAITNTGTITSTGVMSISNSSTTAFQVRDGSNNPAFVIDTIGDIISLPVAVASTTTGTGSLVVAGGVGIGGSVNVGGRVGIGTNLLTGQINIRTSTASTPGIIVQGAASQTEDYLRIVSSTGTTSLTIDSSYKIAWPNTGTNPAKIYGTTYSTQGRVVVEGNLYVSTGPFIVNTGGGEASMTSTAISFGGVGWGSYGSPARVNTDNAVRIQPTSTSVVPLVVQLQNASWTSGNAFEIQNNSVLKFNVDYAGNTSILSTAGSASTTTGALVITGGVGIGQTLFTSPSYASSVSGVILNNGTITGSLSGTATTANNVRIASAGNSNSSHLITFTPNSSSSGSAISSDSTFSFNPSTEILSVSGLAITSGTASTSTTTGSLIVSGGVGIGNTLYVAGRVDASNYKAWVENRTLSSVDTCVGIGTFYVANGAHNLLISLNVSDGGYGVAKNYTITTYWNAGGWRIVAPTSATPGANDFQLEAYQLGDNLTLRARSLSAGSGNNLQVYIQNTGRTNAIFSPYNTSTSESALTIYHYSAFVSQEFYVFKINSSTASTSTSTGALVVTGGVGIGQSLFTSSSYASSISGVTFNNGAITNTGTITSTGVMSISNSSTTAFAVRDGSNSSKFNVDTVGGIVSVLSSTASTSTSSGALVVSGGVGIGGTLNASRLKATSKITFEPGTGTSAISGWTGIAVTSIYRMIYGGNRFVGVGGSYVAYSDDGINFTYTTIPGSTSSASYADIAYGNGVFVAVNQQDVAFIAYSYDGAAWGTTSIPRGLIRTVGFGNGKFLAFSEAPGSIYSSTDGRNWSTIGGLGGYGREVLYANGYFLSPRSTTLHYSVDGISWKMANTPSSNMIFAITYGKGLYIAADYNTAQYYTSTDLVTWTQRSIDNRVWTGASYVNGVFYLIPNNNNNLYHSLDGINWSTTNFGTPIGGTNKMFTANDRLYFFSTYGPTLWSTDATTGTFMAKPYYNGELENIRIGAISPDSATFTNLTALNPVTFTTATGSTASDNGALVVKGGVGIGGSLYVASATAISGVTINAGVITGSLTGTATTSTYSHQSGYAITSGSSATATTSNYSHQSGYAITSGLATTATYSHQSGYATTSGTATTATYSHQSGYATTSGLATTATYSHQSGYATTSGTATTATYAFQSGYGITAGLATTATYAHQSGYAITSGSSGSATTASNINVANALSNSAHTLLFSPTATGSGVAVSSNTTLSYNPSSFVLSTSGLAITATTASSSTSNGALQVAGGVGISGRLSFNQAAFGTTGIATNPTMAMIGNTGDPIFLSILEDNTISFEGSQGQLFSITPNLSTGYIYSVNDITGIPLLRANANANVTANEYAGNFGIGLSNPGYKLHVVGSVGFTSTTASTSTTTGTLVVSGGVGIGGSLNVNSASNISNVIINNGVITGNLTGTATTSGFATTASYSNQAGYAITAGSATTATYSHQAGYAITAGSATTAFTAVSTTSVSVASAGNSNLAHPILITNNPSSGSAVSSDSTFTFNPSTEILNVSGISITSSTGSSNTTTGALIVTGGVGIGGSFNVGNKTRFNDEVYINTISDNALVVGGSGSVSYRWNVGSTLTANRFNLGNDLSLSPVGGSQSVVQSFWGLQLTGNTFVTPSGFTPTSYGSAGAIGVLVPNQQASRVAFGIIAHASQTADLQIWTSSTASTSSPYLAVKADGQIYSYANIPATSFSSGALVVSGGVGIGGSLFVNGDLTINGTTTTINSVTISVDDKNIELGSVSSPSDVTAEGGGITLKGATDKFINWYSGVGWSSSESWNLVSGNSYKINNASVLTSTTLGTGVTNSSLTSLGTITTGVWAGTLITANYGGVGLTTPFTVGDILYANTSTTWGRLTAGTSGHLLSSTGTGSTPSYVNPNTLTVGSATTASNLRIAVASSNLSHPVLFTPGSSTSGSAVSSDSTFSFNSSTEILSVSGLAITSTTSSSGSTTGALTVAGGVGIGGTVNIAGDETVLGRLYYSQSTVGVAGTSTIPSISFIGQDNNPITLSVLTDNTLSFEGSSGQLFSINNNLSSGTIFSVNDISGIPIIRANANGTLSMGEFTGTVGVGLTNPSFKFHVSGSAGFSGTIYATGNVSLASNTASTSTTNGALVVSGGVGIGGSLYVASATAISGVTINAGVITGSLTGTASTSTYSHQSGYAITSGSSNTSGYATTSGLATTATYSHQSGYAITSGIATTARSVSVMDDTVGGSITGHPIVFTPEIFGGAGVALSTSLYLYWNPSSLTLDATNFAGNLQGNVTGNVTGTATTSRNVNIVSASTSASHPVLFTPATGTASGAALSTESTFVYNPSTDILSVSGLAVTSGTASTSTSTGALRVTGGVGIGQSLFTSSSYASSISGVVFNNGAITNTGTITSTGVMSLSNSSTTAFSVKDGSNDTKFNVNTIGGIVSVSSSTASTNTSTGALTVTGGVGIGGTLNAGSVNVINNINYYPATGSTGGIAWSTISLPAGVSGITKMIYANNKFVGVGNTFAVYSNDGLNWSSVNFTGFSSSENFNNLAFGNGKYVALAGSAATVALYSSDAITWTRSLLPASRVVFRGLAYGNGYFVGIDQSNIPVRSTDGINWTFASGLAGYSRNVKFINGLFIATLWLATNEDFTYTSTDGVDWTRLSIPLVNSFGITYGNGKYLASSIGETSPIVSTDLVNWTRVVKPTSNYYAQLYDPSYHNGTFYIPTNFAQIMYSNDLVNWVFVNAANNELVYGADKLIIANGTSVLVSQSAQGKADISPFLNSSIENIRIGADNPDSATFTHLSALNNVSFTSPLNSTSTTNGALVVKGGVGIGGTLNANSVITYNRLQNQSFSGSSVGSTDGLMGNFSTNYQYQSYGNGIYVVSSPGANNARYSTDGVTWQNTTLPVNQAYPINFYGNGYFVLSASGSTTVLYSTNGSSWSQVSIGNTFARTSGVYGNGKYIIVGSGSTYNYSSNLTTWSSATLPFDSTWYITYGNGMFVALGNGTRNLLYSYDGLNWNLGNINTTAGPWSGIKYGNGVFVASSLASPSNNTSGTIYSYDGINWFQGSVSNQDFYNVAYGNGVYFGNNQNAYWTSTDGANWSSQVSFSGGFQSYQSAYAYNKFNTIGRFIEGPTNTVTIEPKFTGEINNVRIGALTPASGDFTNLSSTGSANLVGTVNANNLNILSKINQTPVLGSFAGTTGWTSPVLIASDNNYALAFGNGLFVQIRRTTNSTNFSSDGRRWTGSTMPFTGDWNGVVWGLDKFVAVAGAGTTGAFSRNGIAWTSMNMPSTAQGWIAVTYGDDKFVAVGNTSTAAYSSDGITWSGSSIASTTWAAITYGNGTFVAVASIGRSAAYSHDGIVWNLVNLPTTTTNWQDKKITYGNGYFVVTTYNTSGYDYSRDGVNWSSVNVSGLNRPITYGNGIYSVLNYSNAYYSSDITSTSNWFTSNTINSTDWIAFTYGNNRFVATSYNTGAVAQIDGPSNTLNLHPKFTGDIDNVRIGAKQPAAAEFTNLAAQQPVRFTANTTSINTNTGALVVSGGVGIGGSLYVSSATAISGVTINAGVITGSLTGTASTATYSHQSGYAITSGSSGAATTATYAHQSGYATTSGFATTATYSYQSGYGLTSGLATTATYSHQSGYATTSGLATTATYAHQSGYATTSGSATTATYSYQSGYGITAGFATSATSASIANTSYSVNVTAASANASHFLIFSPTATGSGVALSSESALVYNPSTDILSVSGLAVTSGTASTSATTGALVVTGGVGIGLTLTVGLGISTPVISAPANLLLKPGVDSTTGIQFTRSSAALPVLTIDTLNSRVGIGLTNPEFDFEVNGSISATTKSFVIEHPTKQGMKLRYGSLEGPENGVYVRGELKDNNTIILPDYWSELVDESSITVHLTPIGNKFVYVKEIKKDSIIVGSMFFQKIHCYYSVWAERKDVPKLKVEF